MSLKSETTGENVSPLCRSSLASWHDGSVRELASALDLGLVDEGDDCIERSVLERLIDLAHHTPVPDGVGSIDSREAPRRTAAKPARRRRRQWHAG